MDWPISCFFFELLNICLFSFIHIGSGNSDVEEASRILDQFGKRNMWNLNWLFLELLQISIKIQISVTSCK